MRFTLKTTLIGFLLLSTNYAIGGWNPSKVVASDRGADDQFGTSVSVSGSYSIVGAPNEDHDTSGSSFLSNSGAAYIFEKDAFGNWVQQQKLVASDRAKLDQFGFSVSISGDYAVVGAIEDDAPGGHHLSSDGAGAVYVFHRNASGVLVGSSETGCI